MPASDAAEFIPAWEKTRDYLAQDPAHLDTSLHQAISPDADFQFVNIAHWRSARDFAEAIASPGFQESARNLRWPMHPTLYTVVPYGKANARTVNRLCRSSLTVRGVRRGGPHADVG